MKQTITLQPTLEIRRLVYESGDSGALVECLMHEHGNSTSVSLSLDFSELNRMFGILSREEDNYETIHHVELRLCSGDSICEVDLIHEFEQGLSLNPEYFDFCQQQLLRA